MTGAEYPLQYLHIEIVSYLSAKYDSEDVPDKNMVIAKLESMGFRIGYALSERLSRDQARLNDDLDVLKFICKDFWTSVFGKQVDTLKTNHQGIYVITDINFPLMPLFSDLDEYRREALRYLAIGRGILRGALFNLGQSAVVVTDIPQTSVVRFSVTLKATTTN